MLREFVRKNPSMVIPSMVIPSMVIPSMVIPSMVIRLVGILCSSTIEPRGMVMLLDRAVMTFKIFNMLCPEILQSKFCLIKL